MDHSNKQRVRYLFKARHIALNDMLERVGIHMEWARLNLLKAQEERSDSQRNSRT